MRGMWGVTAWGCDGGSGVWSVQLQPYTSANGMEKERRSGKWWGFHAANSAPPPADALGSGNGVGRWGVGMEELLPALILGSLNIPVGTVHSLGVFPQVPFSPPG